MNAKKLITLAGGALALNAGLFVVNILQAGKRVPDGRSMGEILGLDPEEATWEDVEKLNRRDTMQLFYAAGAPQFEEMQGEYKAKVLSGGVLGGSTAYFTHHVFPTGMLTPGTEWLGKAFMPEGKNGGWGYNLFLDKRTGKVLRMRKMDTKVGPTTIGKDGSDSMHLDYGPYNQGVVHGMHDEVRQVNENLFICAGYLGFSGGPLNPGPFVLIGPPDQWVGMD
ncbi:MAG: hypothetical protein JW854_03615 [Actinobacteria bacterium]|nr:hypothetical protein [Actinomycetota bacterium]